MQWQFWRKDSGPKPIPERIQHVVKFRLNITPEQMANLRMVERAGQYSGRPVRFIRAFDPGAVHEAPETVRYNTLDTQKSAIVFEGHVERNQGVVVYDRRQPVSAPGPAKSAPTVA